tara:strand:- start:1808 stop:2779 length:972 start_codon:yes stop_codon:yes gene_type:complete
MNKLDKVAVTSRSFSSNKQLIKNLSSKYANITLNNSGKTLTGDDLFQFVSDKDKVIVGLEDFNKNLINKLSKLKVISKFGVGLNNIDTAAMSKNNIALGFTPGSNKQAVAELTLMHILLSLRKIPSSKEDIAIKNIWSQNKGNELLEKSIGIIGFGNIGQKLSEILEPFNCKIKFYDNRDISIESLKSIIPNKSSNFYDNLEQSSLESILLESDIISIHLPLLKETKNIIGSRELGLIKNNARIINTSRGGIVDEEALFNHLRVNKDNFACFDVFEVEPAFNNPLLNLENFYATSHLGSMTTESVVAMGNAAIEGLDDNKIPE